MSTGEIDVDGKKVNLKGVVGGQAEYQYQLMARQNAESSLGIGSAGFYILLSSNQLFVTDWNALPKIESALRSFTRPWDGFDDLYKGFAHVSPQFSRSTHVRIVELIAPIAVWISKVELQEDNKLRVEVESSPAVSLDEVALSLIAYLEEGKEERFQQKEKTKIDGKHFAIEASLSAGLLAVKAILTYRGLEVDRAEQFAKPRTDVNPRLVIIQEEGLENFLESLLEENDKWFENKISILFHILGLSVGHYGKIFKDNPDLLAFSNLNDWVLVVECTEREPDINNHFTKLATRTKLILAGAQNIKAYPVLVTKFPRNMLNETEKERGAKEKVSVLTSDDFEPMLKLALEGPSQSKVLEKILEMIPRVESGPPNLWSFQS